MHELLQTLQQKGYILKNEGDGNYRVKGYGGLIVKNSFWYQHSTGKGGNTIQLLEYLKSIQPVLSKDYFKSHIDFKKYSHILLSERPKGRSESVLSTIQCYDIVGYLVNQRKIYEDLVYALINKKLIYQDHYKNACFIGYDENNEIKCISKRATNSNAQLQKHDAKGSDKSYSFSIPSVVYNPTVIITEAPIDALSIACMQFRKHKTAYFQNHIISLCGAQPVNLYHRLLKINPRKIYLAFDNDEVGRMLTHQVYRISSKLSQTRVISYPYGKDPNDWWIYRLNHNF